jgi:acetyl-CoA carboxylase biotin carboxylase subunit
MTAAGYDNAGTVEFLLDQDRRFYFLEVNARLQVEHPVTELVTGVDLVRQQILIAAGEPLAFGQEDLAQRGHAIECRIYAEDPARNFLPSSGKILVLEEPKGPGVRHDGGIYAGWNVPIYYDPILAKLIVWAEDRGRACDRMTAALSDYVLLGIRTTIPFLKDVITHPAFREGRLDTGFIAKHFESWSEKAADAETTGLALAAAAFADMNGLGRRSAGTVADAPAKAAATPWTSIGHWRMGGE